MNFYVYSTLTADNLYTNYSRGGGDLPVPTGGVLVKGGAGVANDRFVTPAGVVTEVTAEQLEYLQQNEVFKLHVRNGFITVDAESRDVEAAASSMNNADGSRPLEQADFTSGDDNEPKPSTGETRKKK